MLKSVAAAMLALAIAAPAWAGVAEDKALVYAAFNLDIEGVKIALAKGADPNTKRSELRFDGATASTPVLLSAIFGREPISTSDALQAGFSVEELWQFVAERRTAIAKALFDAGAKLGSLDNISRTFLFRSPIENGNLTLVELLIDHGASVTAKLDGYTPTELAKKYDREAIYQLLIGRGGIPVDSRLAAQLALNRAAGSGDVEAMERAINNDAKINSWEDADQRTALNVALSTPIYERKQAEAVWWLLDHGANPDMRDKGFSDSPLHSFVETSAHVFYEIKKWNEEDLKALKESTGKVVNPKTVRALNEETLIHLLKAGAKISGIDKHGWTALHAAARFDNIMAAEILIKEGAKIMPRDKQGKTPLDYAESAAMIKLLKQNGATEQ
jgi:ankyrin repeat protein